MNTSKDIYSRVSLTMPEELLRRLNKYCDTTFRDEHRILNLVIRNAIEEFLDKQEEKLESS